MTAKSEKSYPGLVIMTREVRPLNQALEFRRKENEKRVRHLGYQKQNLHRKLEGPNPKKGRCKIKKDDII